MTEIVLWLVVCGLVAGVLTAGAWVWERAARWSGRAARWAWLAAATGSVLLPILVRAFPAERWREAVPVGVVRLDGLVVPAANMANGAVVEAGAVATGVWVILSALVAGYTALLLVRLARVRGGWRWVEVDGAAVLVSRNTGPAAVGVGRAVVVIPEWALELEADLRRLMLLHEREHVRAGDPRLLLGGLLLVAAMPWNPFVWLQFIRLRNAIELDCDARVLRRDVDPVRYGSLLLEIGRRRGDNALVLATFAEPRAFLEQRIRRIAEWPVRRRPVRAALLGMLALALFSSALFARVQVDSVDTAIAGAGSVLRGEDSGEAGSVSRAMAADTPPPVPISRAMEERIGKRPVTSQDVEIADTPIFTPMTERPKLMNQLAVYRALIVNYPPLLRDAGIGGTAVIWFYIDEAGLVRKTQLSKSSGYPALDEAALRVASMMQFVPAKNRGRVVAVWVEIPIMFAAPVETSRVPAAAADTSALVEELERLQERLQEPRPRASSVPPAFTPMTVRPVLKNQADVQHELIRNYPPVLRDGGIGGTVWLWIFIDEEGSVVRMQPWRSSGYPALDQAALSVASVMQFEPARNRSRSVAVWIGLPIHFTVKQHP